MGIYTPLLVLLLPVFIVLFLLLKEMIVDWVKEKFRKGTSSSPTLLPAEAVPGAPSLLPEGATPCFPPSPDYSSEIDEEN